MNTSTASGETETFLEALRRQTRDEHSKLEDLPISRSIVSENLTVDEYVRYLQLMYPIVLQIEKSIFPVVRGIVHDVDLRYKSHMIENDLSHIGVEIPQINDVLNFTQPLDAGFAMGIAYVLEGSTLGGRYILKNVSNVLGVTHEKGASYFAGYQNATGNRWKDFLAALVQFNSIDDQEKIISGARFAFQSIYDHLNYD